MADLTPEEAAAKADAITNGMDPAKAEAFAKSVVTSLHKVQDVTIATGNQIHDSFSILEQVQGWAAKAGVEIESMGNLSGAAAVKFGLFGTAIAGARKEMEGFAGLDTGRLGSFTESTKSLLDTVRQKGTALGTASEAGNKLIGMLKGMGVAGSDLSKLMSKTSEELAAFASNILTSADNSLRFQSAFTQAITQAGSGTALFGGLNERFTGIGKNLEHLNEVTSQFHNIMGAAMEEVGIDSVDQMNRYTGALLKIPGGLTAMVDGMDIAGTKTNALTDIIRLAHGANLDVDQTFKDIHQSTSQFGLGVTDAAKLVARYVDVSGDLGAQQEDVRSAITKTTGAFKSFIMTGYDSAKMSQSLTDSVKSWSEALTKAGVPVQTALEMASKYTTQLASMDEAQESFVSQQTGGPGGLLGAMQFEDLLRNDPAKASEKMNEALKKIMGGTILSRQEAEARGQQGASEYGKQRAVLMSGQLGIKAGSGAEADQMIEALRKGKQISSPVNAEKTLSDTLEQGKQFENLSRTAVKEANITAEVVRLTAGDINLGTMENAFSAQTGGGSDSGRGINTTAQQLLREKQDMAAGQTGTTGTHQAMSFLAKTINDMPAHLISPLTSLKEQVTQGPDEAMSDSMPVFLDQPGGREAAQAAAKPSPPQQQQQQSPTVPNTVPASSTTAANSGALLTPQTGNLSVDPNDPNFGTYVAAGRQVGNAATSATRTSDTGTGASAASNSGARGGVTSPGITGPVPVTLAPGTGITVNFTGSCPHCGRGMQTSTQGAIQNAASQSSNSGVGR